jgi:hypothetical protein
MPQVKAITMDLEEGRQMFCQNLGVQHAMVIEFMQNFFKTVPLQRGTEGDIFRALPSLPPSRGKSI